MTISGDVLFFGLMILAVILMFNARRGLLYAFSAFFIWFALGYWMFFSSSPPLTLGEGWADILVYVFFILLPFGSLLGMMNTEIQHEKDGKRWTKYGEEPKIKGPSGYEAYRDKLFAKTRKRGR